MKAKQVTLVNRPDGAPTTSDFAIEEVDLPSPKHGEVLVENHWMSVDPYMRLSLSGPDGLHGIMPLGDVPSGGAVGEIVESNVDTLSVGQMVISPAMGWREAYVSIAEGLTPIDDSAGPIQRFLGIYGLTGVTAWGGINGVLKPQSGETLFIDGAAGAVGSVALQLAKKAGAAVIGSAGSDAKCNWVTDTLGADHCINYKSENVKERLAELAPDGIEMFFDNVGGEQLEIAIDAMKPRGRMALCGAIALYDGENYRTGPDNLFAIIEKHVSMTGFNAGFYYDRAPKIIAEFAAAIASGDLIWEETVAHGIAHAPRAFVDMLDGANSGKMLVKL